MSWKFNPFTGNLDISRPPTDLSGYVPYTGGNQTLVLMAGTTLLAPLRLQVGSLLATPVAGSIEFDGTNFYLTI